VVKSQLAAVGINVDIQSYELLTGCCQNALP
jgi:hypothetical protein